MKKFKFIPFLLLVVGTLGLSIPELFTIPVSRGLTLTFASLNVIGLITLVLKHKKLCNIHKKIETKTTESLK